MDYSFTVWVTGPHAADVQTVADELARRLLLRHVPLEVLDARTPGIEALAGADVERCAAVVAGALARHGIATLVALPAPSRAGRERARAALPHMIEVHVTGEDIPAGYEPPERCEVEIIIPEPGVSAGAGQVLRTLEVLELLPREEDSAYSEEEEREVIRRLKDFGYM